MTDPRSNPYVGPRPFTAADAERFFGREAEASEILSLILAYPAIILYSESGAGKTSLLNARIIPGLIERDCEVIGPIRVAADFGEDFVTAPEANVYTLSSLVLMAHESQDVKALSRFSLREYLEQRPKPETQHAIRPPRVVIFDQFEELFTTRPERWQDRARFMRDVGEALEADPRLRVVFALREEFIASVDALSSELPDGLRTRLRLERLRRFPALEAVEKPLEGTGVSFAPGVADLLVDNLLRIPSFEGGTAEDEFVEPVHLQLVCHRIWESLPEGAKVIGDKDVQTYGDVNSALTAYYESCIARVAQSSGRPESQLRNWFQKNFITSDGTRGLVYRTVRDTGGLPNDIADGFQSLYLIRTETRGSSRWYELAHDRLIAPIIQSNRLFREKREESGGESLDALDLRAQKWRQTGRPETLLLRGDDLAKGRARFRAEGDGLQSSDGIREFLDASDIARGRRHMRRLRQQLLAGLVAVVLLGLVAVRYWWLVRERDEARSMERQTVAKQMMLVAPMKIDGLMWALRAYGGSRRPDLYQPTVRTALTEVGPALWLKRKAPIQNALFSPLGDKVLTIADKELCVWDADTGMHLAKSDAPKKRIWAEAFFSRSGRYVIAHSIPEPAERKKQFTAESDMAPVEFVVWDWQGNTTLPQLDKYPGHADVSVSPDDSTLAIAYEARSDQPDAWMHSGARRVKMFDLARDRELKTVRTIQPVTFISLSPKASRLMTVEADRVRVWDTATGKKIGEIPQNLIDTDVTIVRWKDEDTLFVGFMSTFQFVPTLVHIDRRGFECIPLKIPVRVLDAWFASDGRLLVKADSNTSSDRTVRGYLFDTRGILRQTLDSDTVMVSYRGYSRYFKTGKVVMIEAQEDPRSGVIGCTYQVDAKKVLLPKLSFNELTALSSSRDRLLSVANGVAKLWLADQVRDPNTLGPNELIGVACSRLSNQPELQSILHSDSLCLANTLTYPARRNRAG